MHGESKAAPRRLDLSSIPAEEPAVYAMLVHSAKTDVAEHGALLSKTREQRTVINKHLIFFDLEWIALADGPAQALASHPKLAKYRHWLEQKRVWKPHYLSELEEKILDEKAVTGKSAFGRLFEETTASMRFPVCSTRYWRSQVMTALNSMNIARPMPTTTRVLWV